MGEANPRLARARRGEEIALFRFQFDGFTFLIETSALAPRVTHSHDTLQRCSFTTT